MRLLTLASLIIEKFSENGTETLGTFKDLLEQKLNSVFNSISTLEEITVIQFRQIDRYEGREIVRDQIKDILSLFILKAKQTNTTIPILGTAGDCSFKNPCFIADIQITMAVSDELQFGLTLDESVKIGLDYTKTYSKQVYYIFNIIFHNAFDISCHKLKKYLFLQTNFLGFEITWSYGSNFRQRHLHAIRWEFFFFGSRLTYSKLT